MLRVKNWDGVFEDAYTRKVKTLTWVKIPNTMGVGMKRLIRSPDGWQIYGLWVALIGWLSTRTPRDGILPDAETIAMMLDTSEEMVTKMLDRLTRPDIGWLQEDGNRTSIEHQSITNRTPIDEGGKSIELQDRTGKEQEGEESTIVRARVESSSALTEPEAYDYTLDLANGWLLDSYQRREDKIRKEAVSAGLKPPQTPYQVRDSKAKRAVWNARLAEGWTVDDIRAALFGNAIDVWHLARGKHDWPYVLRSSTRGDMIERFAEEARRSGYDNLKKLWEDKEHDEEQDEEDEDHEGEGAGADDGRPDGGVEGELLDAAPLPFNVIGCPERDWIRIQREIREQELERKSERASGEPAAE